MDRPAGGRESLATKEHVDLRFEALEQRLRAEFREQTTRLVLWIMPTIFAGTAALGAIITAAG